MAKVNTIFYRAKIAVGCLQRYFIFLTQCLDFNIIKIRDSTNMSQYQYIY